MSTPSARTSRHAIRLTDAQRAELTAAGYVEHGGAWTAPDGSARSPWAALARVRAAQRGEAGR